MPKRPRDPNQLAKAVVDIATGETDDPISASKRGQPARGQAGGRKGGKVRAKKLAPARRSEIARHAAEARWKKVR